MNGFRRWDASAEKIKFCVLAGLISLPSHSSAISFVFNDVTPGGMDPAALAGFQKAANIWEGLILDNIQVNLDIRFDNSDISGNAFPAGVLGSAGSTTQGISYTNVRGALILDAITIDDKTASANLPAAPSLSFLTHDANTSAVVTDNNASGNNNTLDVNTANAKALGLRPANDPATDAGISFNNAFTWDFDQSDGVDPGHQDFVGVSVHEIGHALGFTSGVDVVDFTHGAGPGAPVVLDNFRVHTVLDLYRYSAPGQLNYATGGNPYFSIDGGTTNLATFSTGSFNGDGQQASHWEDNLGIGIFDPTANPPGNINEISALDLLSLDVVGYDVVPEPSAFLLSLIGLGFTLRRRR